MEWRSKEIKGRERERVMEKNLRGELTEILWLFGMPVKVRIRNGYLTDIDIFEIPSDAAEKIVRAENPTFVVVSRPSRSEFNRWKRKLR